MSEPLAPLDTDSPPALAAGAAAAGLPRRRLVAAAEVLLCSGVPTQLVIGEVLRAAGWSAETAGGQPSLPFVAWLLVADTFALIVLMVLLLRSHGESARRLWLGSRRIGREALLGLALVPAVFFMVVVMLNSLRLLAPWLHNVAANPLEDLAANSPADAALFAVVAILAGGVREEMQRAFLLDRFEQHLGGPVVGVIVLSVAFGVGHILQGLDAVITTAVLGAFWAVIYLRRRSSVAPLVSHAGFNSLEVLRVAMMGGVS